MAYADELLKPCLICIRYCSNAQYSVLTASLLHMRTHKQSLPAAVSITLFI